MRWYGWGRDQLLIINLLIFLWLTVSDFLTSIAFAAISSCREVRVSGLYTSVSDAEPHGKWREQKEDRTLTDLTGLTVCLPACLPAIKGSLELTMRVMQYVRGFGLVAALPGEEPSPLRPTLFPLGRLGFYVPFFPYVL
jgi:hypothetical protein